MTREERALARIMFHRKVLASDGQSFEDLFTAVMQKVNPRFTPIKPQGNLGDRKNDGYDSDTGHYYQVFAPEDLSRSKADAVAKLKADFAGLKEYWDYVCPVKRFSFVMNDKFKGSHPTIEADLTAIKTAYDLESCDSFLAKHLEDELFSLPGDVIISIIGYWPNPDRIVDIDYSVLNEVIGHIQKDVRPISRDSVLDAPDFEEKIQFNGLSKIVANLLNRASYQVGSIESYFELNSEFTKQQIRDHLSSIYIGLVDASDEADDQILQHADAVFFDMLDALSPRANASVQDAVLVVMAYFFESCDIFEKPNSSG